MRVLGAGRIVSGTRLVMLASVMFAAGCEAEGEQLFEWAVHLEGTVDECNAEPQGKIYEYDYQLGFDGSFVDLSLDGNTFASGQISGCNVSYASVVWGDERDGHELRWQLTGEAVFRYGGTSCNLDDTTDWLGTETYKILYSDHPDIEIGCQYMMSTQGAYNGPVE
jgi:hypothetical protein